MLKYIRLWYRLRCIKKRQEEIMALLDMLVAAVTDQTATIDKVVAQLAAGDPTLAAQAQTLTDQVTANTAKVAALVPAAPVA